MSRSVRDLAKEVRSRPGAAEEIEARRTDKAFQDRIAKSIEDHDAVVRRLAD